MPVAHRHPPLAAAPLSRAQAEALARVLAVLADRGRLRIVSALLHAEDGELCVSDLQEVLGVGQSTVSHHLRRLVEEGIVVRERRGPYAFFSVAPGALDGLRAVFDDAPPRRSGSRARSAPRRAR